MNEESVCNTCPYWARGDEDANGTCRRVPPTMAVVTAADWWCAEHPGRGIDFAADILHQAIVAEEDSNILDQAISPKEPTFTLRGQDLLAPAIVEAWARAAEGEGVSAEKVAGAREIAEAMMKWRPKKVPD